MRDVELVSGAAGVDRAVDGGGVDVNLKGHRVVVWVQAGPEPYPYPDCGTARPRYDSMPRRWRHLDTMQFTTSIEADVPRVKCGTHGVKQLRFPWAESGSHAPGSRRPARCTIDLTDY